MSIRAGEQASTAGGKRRGRGANGHAPISRLAPCQGRWASCAPRRRWRSTRLIFTGLPPSIPKYRTPPRAPGLSASRYFRLSIAGTVLVRSPRSPTPIRLDSGGSLAGPYHQFRVSVFCHTLFDSNTALSSLLHLHRPFPARRNASCADMFDSSSMPSSRYSPR